jgi:hypothetical protein
MSTDALIHEPVEWQRFYGVKRWHLRQPIMPALTLSYTLALKLASGLA